MKVIYKAPGCAPEPRDIPNTLEELQAAKGIAISAVVIARTQGRCVRHDHH